MERNKIKTAMCPKKELFGNKIEDNKKKFKTTSSFGLSACLCAQHSTAQKQLTTAMNFVSHFKIVIRAQSDNFFLLRLWLAQRSYWLALCQRREESNNKEYRTLKRKIAISNAI